MATPRTEAQAQEKLVAYAKARGWRIAHFRKVLVARKDGTKYWATPVAVDGNGFPDLCCVRERVVWVEMKKRKGRWYQEQRDWRAALEAAGQEYHAVYEDVTASELAAIFG